MKKTSFFFAFIIFLNHFLALGQAKINFRITVPKGAKTTGNSVFLAGSFNEWKPADPAWKLARSGDHQYVLKKALSKGIYSYKITRGSWQTVECEVSGKGIANRTLKMNNDTTVDIKVEGWQDEFAPTEKRHTATMQVQVLSEKFDMPELGRQRRIWLYLPKDYEKSRKRYPVIYMHDGQNLFDEYTAGYGEWGIDELMDKITETDQCIIIGVDHGGDNRITEYDPYDSKYGKGRGNDYVDFLVKTLKPYIDRHYRTKTDAKHTAIAGSSMGGLISMYAALKYPEIFGQAGVFSPAFWIAPDIYQYAQQQHLTGTSRFYFVCGDAESDSMVTDMEKMATLVRSKGITEPNSPTVVVKGAQHNEAQWHGDFPAFYMWLVEGFK